MHRIDPDNGARTDIRAVTQVEFAGSAERIETWVDPTTQTPLIDPATGEPVVDPDTGEPVVDPDTGEIVLDPNSGETITWIIPAIPQAISGTRYLSSDDTVATVDANGRITAHAAGRAVISVIHLATTVNEYGEVVTQAIGQTDIPLTVMPAQLTDTDDLTPAPQRILMTAAVGGAVAASSGETVMIGAGALATDTAGDLLLGGE